MRRRGIGGTAYTDFSGKRARQVTGEDYKHYDYLLCADTANIRNTIRITGADTEGKIRLLLDYTDRPGCSIADPWYSGNFEDTYRDVDAGCEGFLAYLKEKGAIWRRCRQCTVPHIFYKIFEKISSPSAWEFHL